MLIYIIETKGEGNNTMELLSPFVIHNVPLLIDSLIEVEKGRLIFNQQTKSCVSSLLLCTASR